MYDRKQIIYDYLLKSKTRVNGWQILLVWSIVVPYLLTATYQIYHMIFIIH